MYVYTHVRVHTQHIKKIVALSSGNMTDDGDGNQKEGKMKTTTSGFDDVLHVPPECSQSMHTHIVGDRFAQLDGLCINKNVDLCVYDIAVKMEFLRVQVVNSLMKKKHLMNVEHACCR